MKNKKYIVSSTLIASSIRRLSLCLLMLGCFTTPSWGQEKKVEIVGKPRINEDNVTVRFKAEENNRPVVTLQDTDFTVKVDGKKVEFQKWKSPKDINNQTLPAWIIVLLDFSGSMQQPDSRGTTKFEGAINAIREFIELSEQGDSNVQVAIVPFGQGGSNCEVNRVDKETLDRFFSAGDFKLQNYLDTLESRTPCASTNLYEPLKRAVRFLANPQDSRFQVPKDLEVPQPRRSIILLSDGYHNAENEKRDFDDLERLLRQQKDIIVHTLGYGLTPEQLGKKYNLGRSATRKDIGVGKGKVPEAEFVDKDRLEKIAELTGGIAEFSGDSQAIAQSLELFLYALLGEYEITYQEPNADRASKHNVSVSVRFPKDDKEVESESRSYRITVFGRSLPVSVRLSLITSSFLLLGFGWVLPFSLWGQKLEDEADG
jgi:von Willebrand factor type A domain